MQTTYTGLQHFLSPPQSQMDLQNMEIFVIKKRYHCYVTKSLHTIKAEVIKQMHSRKEKILPRVLKQVGTTYQLLRYSLRETGKHNREVSLYLSRSYPFPWACASSYCQREKILG